MREMITAIPVLILLSPVAAAQGQSGDSTARPPTPPPASAAGTVPQAPVGHRQPTQGGLPPPVRQEEDTVGNKAVDGLGPVPRICRNC